MKIILVKDGFVIGIAYQGTMTGIGAESIEVEVGLIVNVGDPWPLK
jgi:hypothetical protein